jgi:hypothetical protein
MIRIIFIIRIIFGIPGHTVMCVVLVCDSVLKSYCYQVGSQSLKGKSRLESDIDKSSKKVLPNVISKANNKLIWKCVQILKLRCFKCSLYM